MDAIKILERPSSMTWNYDYDEEADVLYLSAGSPRSAVGIDIGDGWVLRYDEAHCEVVGLTVIGLRDRLAQSLDIPAEE